MLIQRRSAPALAALAVGVIPIPLHTLSGAGHTDGRPGPSVAAPAKRTERVPASKAAPPPTHGLPHLGRTHSWRHPVLTAPTDRHTSHSSVGVPLAPHARAAGDPGDTISDFQFSPGTITIHVGDTVTWTNNGPSAHTATATNGGFDTGTLQKGSSASHTFTRSGTFAYICSIHPFMHGTVVVLASATSTTPAPPASTPSSAAGGSSGSSPTSTSKQAVTAAAPTLPVTGLDLLATLLSGLVLASAGIAIRHRRPG
jgi:plastocyanin